MYAYYTGHGDLAAEANQAGTKTAAYTYDPYGQLLTGGMATDTGNERYTGRWDKKHDTTTNLIEMGVRPYDPTLGRFLSVDPIEGGSANAYDYANQDSVGTTDISGMAAPLTRAKKRIGPLKKHGAARVSNEGPDEPWNPPDSGEWICDEGDMMFASGIWWVCLEGRWVPSPIGWPPPIHDPRDPDDRDPHRSFRWKQIPCRSFYLRLAACVS